MSEDVAHDVRKARILVVDDNPQNLKLVRILLEAEGHEVVTAAHADEAMRVLEQGELPHLILMDVQMPGTDGLSLTRQLKANARYERVVIVALTAYAMKGDDLKVTAAGCDGYITKPIDVSTFPDLVGSYLAR